MKKLVKENIVVRFLRYIATWRKHRAIIKELNAMSDRELADIGLTRDMISTLIFRDEELK